MKLHDNDRYSQSQESAQDRDAGRGDYDASRYDEGEKRRPFRTFKSGKVGWSIWPAFNDPEQPKFFIEAGGYRNQQTGAWENRRSFYYNETVALYRTLYQAIKWCCDEAGMPMPGVEPEKFVPPPPQYHPAPPDERGSQGYREPGDMGDSVYRQSKVGEQEYRENKRYQEQSYPQEQYQGPRLKDKDKDIPF